jgi:hypothetical protein
VDVAEPPRIVFENPAGCTDADRVEDVLRRAVASTRAAPAGATLTLRVVRTGPGATRAEGVIADDRDVRVADRVLFGTGLDCVPLAQAVGVWASLVLDSRSVRADSAGDDRQAAMAPPAETESTETAASSSGGGMGGGGKATDMPGNPGPEERDGLVHRDAGRRRLELGASAFLMAGAWRAPMAGVSPFVFIGMGGGFFLRPAIAAGETVTAVTSGDQRATLVDARLDACVRVHGTYATNLVLDLCGGNDIGSTWGDGNRLLFAAVGPSFDLGSDLETGVSVRLRGVFGVNLAHTQPTWGGDEVPALSGRAELALSWHPR